MKKPKALFFASVSCAERVEGRWAAEERVKSSRGGSPGGSVEAGRQGRGGRMEQQAGQEGGLSCFWLPVFFVLTTENRQYSARRRRMLGRWRKVTTTRSRWMRS